MKELLISKVEHLDTCQVKLCSELNKDPFHSIKMVSLIKSNKTPKQVIKEYNKGTGQKLVNNEANRKKISNIRYAHKESKVEEDEESQPIISIQHLKNFINENLLSAEEIEAVDNDSVFVCGADKNDDNLTVVLTTKNLLGNYLKSSKIGELFICVDGTYRLNDLGYPLLTLGTVDLNKKLHISNILFFFKIKFNSIICNNSVRE